MLIGSWLHGVELFISSKEIFSLLFIFTNFLTREISKNKTVTNISGFTVLTE